MCENTMVSGISTPCCVLSCSVMSDSLWSRGLQHSRLLRPWRSPGKNTSSVQFSPSVVSDFFDPMDGSRPGFPVHHQLLELTQTHIHQVGDAIQPSHPLSSPSPPAFSPSQHQGLFQWVGSLNQVAKVLEFQLQHQSFQWIFRTDFL